MLPLFRLIPVGGVLLAIAILLLALDPPRGTSPSARATLMPAHGALIDRAAHPEWRQFLIQAALRRAGEVERLRDLHDTVMIHTEAPAPEPPAVVVTLAPVTPEAEAAAPVTAPPKTTEPAPIAAEPEAATPVATEADADAPAPMAAEPTAVAPAPSEPAPQVAEPKPVAVEPKLAEPAPVAAEPTLAEPMPVAVAPQVIAPTPEAPKIVEAAPVKPETLEAAPATPESDAPAQVAAKPEPAPSPAPSPAPVAEAVPPKTTTPEITQETTQVASLAPATAPEAKPAEATTPSEASDIPPAPPAPAKIVATKPAAAKSVALVPPETNGSRTGPDIAPMTIRLAALAAQPVRDTDDITGSIERSDGGTTIPVGIGEASSTELQVTLPRERPPVLRRLDIRRARGELEQNPKHATRHRHRPHVVRSAKATPPGLPIEFNLLALLFKTLEADANTGPIKPTIPYQPGKSWNGQ